MSKKLFLAGFLLAICLFGFVGQHLEPTAAETDNKNIHGGTELWKTALSYYEAAPPTVVNNLIYTSSSSALYGGSVISVYCINDSTGEIVWQVTGQFAKFSVSNSYVYVSYESLNYSISGNYVSCLDAYTGTQLWNFTDGNYLGEPLAENGVLYVGATSNSATGGGHTRSQGYIYALNASTGTQLWRYEGPIGSGFAQSNMLLDAYLCVTGTDGVYAVNPSNGSLQWSFSTSNLRSINSQNGTILTSRYDEHPNTVKGEVIAFSEATGKKLWSYLSPDITKIYENDIYRFTFPISNPIFYQNSIYIAAQNGDVISLKTSDGSEIWQRQLNNALWQRESPTSPAVGDGKVFVGCPAGIYCLSASGGNILWQHNENAHSNTLTSHPAYSDGIVYVGFNNPVTERGYNEARNFYAFNAGTGNKLWNYSLYDRFLSAPIIVNGTLYVGGATESFRGLFLEPAVLVALKAGGDESSLTDLNWGIALVIIVAIAASLIAYGWKKQRKQNSKRP